MKKIMFNDRYGLTEAVLSSRKTQTRRLIPIDLYNVCDWSEENPMFEDSDGDWHPFYKSKYVYKVGEVVAVAQSYKDAGFVPDMLQTATIRNIGIVDVPISTLPGWTNKMFTFPSMMPHQIRISNVRVERLQDISDEDCIKEGIGISASDNRIGYPFGIPFNYYVGEDKEGCRYSTPREAYAALIDKITGKGTWNSNPYVFVYDFELAR